MRLLQVGQGTRHPSSSPVLVVRVFGMPSSSKSTSCSCFGEPRFTSRPISAYACWASASARSPSSRGERGELRVVDRDAARAPCRRAPAESAARCRRARRRELSDSSARSASATRSVYQALGRGVAPSVSGTSWVGIGLRAASRRGSGRRGRRASCRCRLGRSSQPATSVSNASPSNARPDAAQRLELRLGVGDDLRRVAGEPRLERGVLGCGPAATAAAADSSARRDADADHAARRPTSTAEAEPAGSRRDGALEPAPRAPRRRACARSARRGHGARPRRRRDRREPPSAARLAGRELRSRAPAACGTRAARRSARTAWRRSACATRSSGRPAARRRAAAG